MDAIVSIHAPMQGATSDSYQRVLNHFVSIHAPMQGATMLITMLRSILRFQSTPLCKGRPSLALKNG